MKVVAIDFGTKRTGLAISDPAGRMAVGLPLYEMRGDGGDAERIAERVRAAGAERVVAGLPRNMDGTEGPAAERVRAFASELEAFLDVPVEFVDERLTSEEAGRRLAGLPISRARRKEHTNTVAAQVILEAYLAERKPEAGGRKSEEGRTEEDGRRS